MGLAGAFGQIAVVATILLAGSLYTRHHVAHMQRADHAGMEYLEDSRAGNGTRYRVIQRAADTTNASYTVEVLVRGTAEGFVNGLAGSLPAHMHPEQDEVLHVKAGQLGVIQGAGMHQQTVLAAGQQVSIKRGTPHTLYNADNSSDVVYELQHSPAGPMGEGFFEALAGLGWDYTSLDRMHPLQVLVLYHDAGTVLFDLPQFLQPAVNKILVPLAKLLGFKSHYPSHTSAARLPSQPTAAAAGAPARSEPSAAAEKVVHENQNAPAESQAAGQEVREEVELHEVAAAFASSEEPAVADQKEEL